MYFKHFGLVRNPFLLSTSPGSMYYSAGHCEAAAQLLYAVRECKGIVLMTGEPGTGKTTLLHAVLNMIRPAGVATCTILNPMIETAQDLLCSVLAGFKLNAGQRPPMEVLGMLRSFLEDQARQGRRSILVVDEAQQLSSRTLNNLRLISNLESNGDPIIQLVLSAQPEIRQVLAETQQVALRQRIVARCVLRPLQAGEMWNYLAMRFARAGSDGRLVFLPDAVERLALASGCTPRVVNVLGDNCLIAAYARGEQTVDAALVDRVAVAFELSADCSAGGNVSHTMAERTPERWKKLVAEYATCEIPEALRNFAGALDFRGNRNGAA